jgi:hypothetical protein
MYVLLQQTERKKNRTLTSALTTIRFKIEDTLPFSK